MKSLHIFICFFYVSINSYGQTEKLFNINLDSISLVITQDSLERKNISDSLSVENWKNFTYNPYKKEGKVYPFNIVFTDSTYCSPIERNIVITSRYGWRNRRPHKGIDIDLVTGDDVKSMFNGKVRYVNYHSGHGKTVVVRHYNGLETAYSHLSKQLVKVNDTVKKGQVIGKGGTTGNARGSHLHLEVSFKGIYIHPEYLFDFSEKHEIRSQNTWVTKNWVTPYYHNSKRQSNISICTTYEEALESEKKHKKIYVVKRGDTLSKISNKYHVSIRSLCKTNTIKKTSTLKIGQKLVVIQ